MPNRDFVTIANAISIDKKYSNEILKWLKSDLSLQPQLLNLENRVRDKLIENTVSYTEFLNNNFNRELQPMLNLYFSTVFAGSCFDLYKSKGISTAIYTDTMNDINIWSRKYFESTGSVGLREISWIKNHLMFKLFKLGRLQFEMSQFNDAIYGFSRGSDCLNIHINAGEKLDLEECKKSIHMAKDFFKKYFEIDYKLAVCNSWLLSTNLAKILDKGSNIVKFSRLFNVYKNDDDNRQAIDRVFGDGTEVNTRMPENTSLQKIMKSHLLSGQKIGMGFGVIIL